MKVYMLHEDRLGALPPEIKELDCFDDHMTVVVGDDEERIEGRSVYLEGSKEAFVEWLGAFDHVWIGEGQPNEERFGIYHIEEEIESENHT